MLTGRDSAHTWLLNEKPTEARELLKGSVIYHYVPVRKKNKSGVSYLL